MDNEIKIIFRGDDKLSDKIKKLDNATKKLLNTQAKIRDFNERIVKSNNKNKNSLKKLRIQLQLQGKEFKNLNLPLKMYKDALKGNDLELAKINQATKKYIVTLKKQRIALKTVNTEQKKSNTTSKVTSKNLLSLGHSARNGTADLGGMGGAFSVLRSKLLLFNFAMGLGIRQVGKLVAESSRVEAMRTAFSTLTGESDGLTISLEKITKATNGTMSEFDLFQQANNAMILGVTKNSDEMAEMFDIAQRLGRALGKDTAQSVESLVTGIGRQSRLMLDNIGIIVKSEEAYESYAKKINKTANELTDAEKKQAFLEATMESARKKVSQLGEEVLTTKDTIDQFNTSTANLSVSIGELLAPAFGKMAKESTTVINNLTELAKLAGHTDSVSIKYFKTLETMPDFIKKYSKEHNIAIDSTKSLQFQLQQLLEVFSEEANIEKNKFLGGSTMQNALARTEEAYNNLIKVTDDYNKLTQSEEAKKAREEELSILEKQKNELKKKHEEQVKGEKMFQKLQEVADKKIEEREKLQEKIRIDTAKKVAQELKAITGEILEDEKRMVTEAEAVKKDVLGNTFQFQLDQLNILEEKFKEHHESTLESDQFFANERVRITNEEVQQKIKAQTEGMAQILGGFNSLTGAMEQELQSRKQNELNALKDTNAYQRASNEERKNMEHTLIKGFAKDEKRMFYMKKASSLAQIYIDTASAVTEALPNIPLSVLIGAMGLAQATVVAGQQPPQFETGGLVGGQRHYQGGTMIEAEQGEFVMSRNAVQAIGVETLNQMNQGGGGGLTINVTAPLVDETVIDSIIPAIEKAQRMNLA